MEAEKLSISLEYQPDRSKRLENIRTQINRAADNPDRLPSQEVREYFERRFSVTRKNAR